MVWAGADKADMQGCRAVRTEKEEEEVGSNRKGRRWIKRGMRGRKLGNVN